MRSLLPILLLVASAREISACAPAPRPGDQITIVEESAVIVWEPATKTQHFIRNATFRGQGHDFGFLVPTPTTPALDEVSDDIFTELEIGTRRPTVYVKRREMDFTPLLLRPLASRNASEGEPAGAGVSVLETRSLAGYEAAVLDASDATALLAWLRENGYAASDDLLEWLDVYVRQRWKMTAFKVDPRQGAIARTQAVKMSFTTDRPFFPYREPVSQRGGVDGTRTLRVFFLGPERVHGMIGAAGEWEWPGVLLWSNTLRETFRRNLERMAGVPLPPSTRLTALVDSSSVRPGVDDLFFARAADQRPFVPPPYVEEEIVRIPLPLDAAVALAAVPAVIFIRRKRRRRRAEY